MYCACCLFCFTSVVSAGQNLLVNRPCCHSEHFAPLYRIVMYLYFVVNFVCYFELCDFNPSGYHVNKSKSESDPFLDRNALTRCIDAAY